MVTGARAPDKQEPASKPKPKGDYGRVVGKTAGVAVAPLDPNTYHLVSGDDLRQHHPRPGRMIGPLAVIAGTPAVVKVAGAAAGALTTGVLWAATMTWTSLHAVFAQETGTVDLGSLSSSIIPATALTVTASALAYVVRLIATGALVHRDPTIASERLRDALADTTKALAAATDAIVESRKREEEYHALLLTRLDRPPQGGRGFGSPPS